MGLGELQGARGGDVDLLAAGDDDALLFVSLGVRLVWFYSFVRLFGGRTRAAPLPARTVVLPGGQPEGRGQ